MRSFSFWQWVCGHGVLPWMIATLTTSPSALGAKRLPPSATNITTTAGSTKSRQLDRSSITRAAPAATAMVKIDQPDGPTHWTDPMNPSTLPVE